MLDLSRVGGGVPDLLVSRQSRAILVEVKAPKGKLRASQTGWQDGWRGIPVVVCRSTDDVAKIVGVV